jgi:hypothetical protein
MLNLWDLTTAKTSQQFNVDLKSKDRKILKQSQNSGQYGLKKLSLMWPKLELQSVYAWCLRKSTQDMQLKDGLDIAMRVLRLRTWARKSIKKELYN